MTRPDKDDALPGEREHKLTIVAVTACATGVAHTYMAAEQLEKLAKEHRFAIKIETQGVFGIKNHITEKDIIASDLVIIASDIKIDNTDRFAGSRILNVSINALLLSPDEVVTTIRKILHFPRGKVIDM